MSNDRREKLAEAYNMLANMPIEDAAQVLQSYIGSKIGYCINGFEPGSNARKVLEILTNTK